MFFFFSKILDLFLSPLTWGIVLGAFAIPWRPGKPQKPKRQRVFGIASLVVFVVFSSAPVGNGLYRLLEASAHDTTKPDTTYDVVVFLGGIVDGDPTALSHQTSYNDNVERLFVTYDLLRTGRARYAITSGGTEGASGVNEGETVRDQLIAWGIDPDRVIAEPKALNTHENAVYSAAIIKERGFSKIVLVTSAYHMKRGVDCFHAVGLDPDTLPADYRGGRFDDLVSPIPRSWNLDASTHAIRELFGRFVYRMNGYAKPAP